MPDWDRGDLKSNGLGLSGGADRVRFWFGSRDCRLQTCQLSRCYQETPGFDLCAPVLRYFLPVACFNEVMEYFPDSNIWQEI